MKFFYCPVPDCTGNPFGAHDDLILINFPAKRLKGKAGTKDEKRTEADSPYFLKQSPAYI